MEKNVKFSIIVPVFNTYKPYMDDCINSLVNLDYDNYEVILVDDGSNLETKEHLNQYKDSHIKLITHEVNKGLANSRKTGINIASGDYSLFLDSDDILDTESLNVINDIIKKTGSDVIMFSLPRFSKNITNITVDNSFFENGVVTKEKVMTELLSLHTNAICEKCARTELMKRCYEDIDSSIIMGEDLQQSTNLVLNSNTFYFTNKRIYYYRINEVKRDYYDQTNLNDMNFTLPTYRKVFVEHDEYAKFLPVYKSSTVNAIIYRTFKLCKYENYKELINKLIDMDIVKVAMSIDKIISFPQEMIFSLIINKHYLLIKMFATIYNKMFKEF